MNLSFWQLCAKISLAAAIIFILVTIVLIIRFKIFSLVRFEIISKRNEKKNRQTDVRYTSTVTSDVSQKQSMHIPAQVPDQPGFTAATAGTDNGTVSASTDNNFHGGTVSSTGTLAVPVHQSTGTVISGQSIPGGTVIAGAFAQTPSPDPPSDDFVILKNIIVIHSDPKIIG